MKFKIGDNVMYQGEVGRVVVVDNSDKNFPYRVKFHSWGLQWMCEEELQEAPEGKTYEQGLADAWELARKLYCEYTDFDRKNILGITQYETVLTCMMPEEVFSEIEAYEKEREIKVRSIVKDKRTGGLGIVTGLHCSGQVYVMWCDGSCGLHEKDDFINTGRTAEGLTVLLRQIGDQ